MTPYQEMEGVQPRRADDQLGGLFHLSVISHAWAYNDDSYHLEMRLKKAPISSAQHKEEGDP